MTKSNKLINFFVCIQFIQSHFLSLSSVVICHSGFMKNQFIVNNKYNLTKNSW